MTWPIDIFEGALRDIAKIRRAEAGGSSALERTQEMAERRARMKAKARSKLPPLITTTQ